MMIRQLQPSDVEAYQQVRRHALRDVPQFVGPLAEQDTLCDFVQLRSRVSNGRAEGVFRFGCFLDECCVGVAAFSRHLNPKYSHKVFFWGLYILPEFRGRSIGRRFMEDRIHLARSLAGVRFATLQMTTTNEPARALHQRFGFVSCGVEPQALCLDGRFYDVELLQMTLAHAA